MIVGPTQIPPATARPSFPSKTGDPEAEVMVNTPLLVASCVANGSPSSVATASSACTAEHRAVAVVGDSPVFSWQTWFRMGRKTGRPLGITQCRVTGPSPNVPARNHTSAGCAAEHHLPVVSVTGLLAAGDDAAQSHQRAGSVFAALPEPSGVDGVWLADGAAVDGDGVVVADEQDASASTTKVSAAAGRRSTVHRVRPRRPDWLTSAS